MRSPALRAASRMASVEAEVEADNAVSDVLVESGADGGLVPAPADDVDALRPVAVLLLVV